MYLCIIKSHVLLGRLYEKSEPEAAIEAFEQSVELGNNEVEVMVKLAKTYQQEKNYNKFTGIADKILALAQHPEIHYQLALYHEDQAFLKQQDMFVCLRPKRRRYRALPRRVSLTARSTRPFGPKDTSELVSVALGSVGDRLEWCGEFMLRLQGLGASSGRRPEPTISQGGLELSRDQGDAKVRQAFSSRA